jgi:hypothetical protein
MVNLCNLHIKCLFRNHGLSIHQCIEDILPGRWDNLMGNYSDIQWWTSGYKTLGLSKFGVDKKNGWLMLEDLKPSQGGQMISLTYIHIWLNMMFECPVKWWHDEYLINLWLNCICLGMSKNRHICKFPFLTWQKIEKWIKQYQTYRKMGFKYSNQMFGT